MYMSYAQHNITEKKRKEKLDIGALSIIVLCNNIKEKRALVQFTVYAFP